MSEGVNEAFPDPRTLMRKYGLGAKKSWGQNFLISERAYRAIVDAAVRGGDDWVIEFGAGLGTLTMRLAERVPDGKVLAVERDREMAEVLRGELGHLDNVEIIEGNALTYDIAMVGRWYGERVSVCGNLPYNIASQIIMHIIDAREHVARATVMIQREMADRLVAVPGTKAYGALGVLVGTFADVSTVIHVPASGFVPAPKVSSTVVRLDLLSDEHMRVQVSDFAHYADVVHGAFGQRRKKLRNALGARWPMDVVDAGLSDADIDGGRRGETLDRVEFARLADHLPKRPREHARTP
ncbi:16S rRNA (adenine(1518)-N(6)/adenine(1519)-N(6))-dimethyltransferase RsmA [Haliangium ochraceum]|uniref:Ribosomal RNA small subunit methyltransferase A n=1 Tax=Haliangium ochraceum (strain DSM 14365 / JCM 11303 / SMP-2) TaxID=502025 RepID=D0LVN1_HALO1|nr:16S rRNA (adenine(1518)-N(6)/adenine(1519)-N(6))-dimethyltransferase RsmA [Haliangium ochraceum]ACY19349.1 dimethyladenosine transferase [Haliangium ochraceum DSM 14365]